MFHKFFKFFINRYFLATVAFLAWIIFFDNYSLVRQYKLGKQLREIKEMKQHYITQIEENRKELEELVTNKKTEEKFAREKYLMKKDNEDIYVVIRE